MRKLVVVAVVFAMALMVFALPASATVHEMTGMWCATGHSQFDPPGISGGSSADNFAQPLFASGAASVVGLYNDGTNGDHPLIAFNFDAPQVKIVDTGIIVYDAEAEVYLTLYELDSSAGFYNCQYFK